MNALAGGFEAGAQERDRRTLTVGAGDVDHRRKMLMRIAERGEQTLDPVKAQIDQLRVKREQPGEDRVAVQGEVPLLLGAASAMPEGGAGLMIMRISRAKVARSSLRGTTRSTIPCSSKYSAR